MTEQAVTSPARFNVSQVALSGAPSAAIERKVFQGDRSRYAKILAVIGVGVISAILLGGRFYLGETNPKFYLFMCGGTALVLTGRYFSMMGLRGPNALVFDNAGLTLQGARKSKQISWSDLRSIRLTLIRGG